MSLQDDMENFSDEQVEYINNQGSEVGIQRHGTPTLSIPDQQAADDWITDVEALSVSETNDLHGPTRQARKAQL